MGRVGGGTRLSEERVDRYGYVIGFNPRVAAPLTRAFEVIRGGEERGGQGHTARGEGGGTK